MQISRIEQADRIGSPSRKHRTSAMLSEVYRRQHLLSEDEKMTGGSVHGAWCWCKKREITRVDKGSLGTTGANDVEEREEAWGKRYWQSDVNTRQIRWADKIAITSSYWLGRLSLLILVKSMQTFINRPISVLR